MVSSIRMEYDKHVPFVIVFGYFRVNVLCVGPFIDNFIFQTFNIYLFKDSWNNPRFPQQPSSYIHATKDIISAFDVAICTLKCNTKKYSQTQTPLQRLHQVSAKKVVEYGENSH